MITIRLPTLNGPFVCFCAFFCSECKRNGKRLSVVGFSHDVALQRSFFRTLFVPPPPTAVTFELISYTCACTHTSVHAGRHTAFFFVKIFGHHLSVKTWLSTVSTALAKFSVSAECLHWPGKLQQAVKLCSSFHEATTRFCVLPPLLPSLCRV